MKHLIVLAGVGRSGKTTTLRLVARHLDSLANSWIKIYEANPKSKKDNEYLFKHIASGKVVGIHTWGDDGEHIKKATAMFDKNNCEIVICATKAKWSEALETMQKWIETNSADKEIAVVPLYKLMYGWSNETEKIDRGNEFTKNVIVNMINLIIGGVDIGAIY